MLSTKNHYCDECELTNKILKPEKDTLKQDYFEKNRGESQFKIQIYHK